VRVAAGYELTRQQHIARSQELVPELAAHVDWTAGELRRAQDGSLRRLVRHVVGQSPWHRDRLATFDVSTLTAADLSGLPVMTKSDLMDNFDAIVTDRRLTLDVCERHVDALRNDAYLLDEFHVVASGGSSGRRGVFVYDWDAWATCYSSITRFPARDRKLHPELAGSPPVVATVAAANASHISAAMGATFSTPDRPRHSIPVSQPIEQIVDRLNDLQPTTLMGYSSFLPRLAMEARTGRLRIAPQRVVAISEPLLPEARADLEATWGVPVASGYGMSEGLFVGFCGHGSHLPDDLCLLELVSADGTPVDGGATSAKVYVTNLYNTVVPLIRFEVTDEVSVLEGPCPCGSPFRRIADPLGRLDETFVYPDGTTIHPHVFRSCLGHQHLIEYQVRQTARGADISAVTSGAIDTDALASRIEGALLDLGLPAPTVTIATVDGIDRQRSGKLKRFVCQT
jgi:phenylacetate-coenzyme A ligase PaaK-like adenylate-forming protein